jgi:MFS family permease
LYASLSAFGLYTCIYAFRKAFAVATFEDIVFLGISYKVWLVTFQVAGYALSKFIGIKIISELRSHSRAGGILLMVSIAAVSWLLFALIPPPFNILFLFFTGLPLGLVWGMIFAYLEGRQMTEVLGISLSVSFIFSAGFSRTVGSLIMENFGTSEYWMPFVTSCLFIIPLLLFLFLLDKLPPPGTEDVKHRTKRMPMNGDQRYHFLMTFLPGIILFIIAYMLLTTFRDFRDNFSVEIWTAVNDTHNASIYTTTEIAVSLLVLACMGGLILIKNNQHALMMNHVIIVSGFLLIGAANLLFENSWITASTWMVLIGTGLYMGYIPFNSIFFDRLLATFQYSGTVGFIMYLADAFGYLGSIGVLYIKEFIGIQISWLTFFMQSGYFISMCGTLLMTASMVYFYQKEKGYSFQLKKRKRALQFKNLL